MLTNPYDNALVIYCILYVRMKLYFNLFKKSKKNEVFISTTNLMNSLVVFNMESIQN